MTEIESFTVSFRRVMHLAVLLDAACEYLNMESETPSFIAANSIDMRKSIDKLMKSCKRDAPATWEKIAVDLDSDQLHDTNLIIDELAGVANVGEILDAIRSLKVEALSSQSELSK